MAFAFFEVWADRVEFKRDEETIRRRMMKGDPISAEWMLAVLEQFPRRIKAIANQLSVHHNEGPFPLCHDNLLHSDILVDEDTFSVTGIIDWEGACTVPWELVAFPEFLEAVPVAFDLLEKCDPEG